MIVIYVGAHGVVEGAKVYWTPVLLQRKYLIELTGFHLIPEVSRGLWVSLTPHPNRSSYLGCVTNVVFAFDLFATLNAPST